MSITTIVHFEVPAENVERFYACWQDHIKASVSKQPGLIDGILHRSVDADGPYQFVNVAHWESAAQLASGLKATAAEIPVVQVLSGPRRHDVAKHL
jgi:heme-degrading monooxygenase HmoA